VSLTVDQIPDRDAAAAGGGLSTALSALPAAPRRRTVLRAITLGGLTIGVAALGWSGRLTGRARAETGQYGLQGWDRTDCRDAYPHGYAEVGDTGGDYANTYGACFGGTWISSNYCEAGWHKFGTWNYGGFRADHVPISSACGTLSTKNSWRWTTPDGVTYRCSDGYTTFWGGPNDGQTFLTVCRSR
jgi:hypothetical protein